MRIRWGWVFKLILDFSSELRSVRVRVYNVKFTDSNARQAALAVAQASSLAALAVRVGLALSEAFTVLDVSFALAAVVHVAVSSEPKLVAVVFRRRQARRNEWIVTNQCQYLKHEYHR